MSCSAVLFICLFKNLLRTKGVGKHHVEENQKRLTELKEQEARAYESDDGYNLMITGGLKEIPPQPIREAAKLQAQLQLQHCPAPPAAAEPPSP